MALLVIEFQDQGYKIRKIFEKKKSTYPKEIIKFLGIGTIHSA